jgi:hypothetical protein
VNSPSRVADDVHHLGIIDSRFGAMVLTHLLSDNSVFDTFIIMQIKLASSLDLTCLFFSTLLKP